MKTPVNILTILGSPHDANSNTKALANDFLDEVEASGIEIRRTFIALGSKTVQPCRGCWNCTIEKPCPLRADDLEEIKQEMLACDMLILASPVYTNQVTAQMKAMIDRLFTWCHMFPLLGKYGLSMVTTGNDGQKETGDYLEKILATYGIASFGTIIGAGAYTPGFFPRREMVRENFKSQAEKVANTLSSNKQPPVTPWQKKMFKVMKRKMTGVHAINYIQNGPSTDRPDPPRFMVQMIKKLMNKRGVADEQVAKLSRLMAFELGWWTKQGWLSATSFRQLALKPASPEFDAHSYLLATNAPQ